MNRICVTLLLLLALAFASFRLHGEKQHTDEALGELKGLFQAAAGGHCRVNEAVLQQHKSLLPDTLQAVQQAVFIDQLQEAVGILDDYGIDRKWTTAAGKEKTMSFYTAKNGGLTCSIRFQQKGESYTILSVSGLSAIHADWHRCAAGESAR